MPAVASQGTHGRRALFAADGIEDDVDTGPIGHCPQGVREWFSVSSGIAAGDDNVVSTE
jgi:hypothetical protein